MLLLLFVVVLYVSNLLQPLDRMIYDAQIRFFDRKPQDDIIIVAVDLSALESYGRWPWSREIHAKFLDKLTLAEPAVIVMDFLFSEASNATDDARLAQSIADNQRIVLPVAPESAAGLTSLKANLPLAAFLQGAAGIGHIDRELDLDAISRRTYLYAGLSGSVQWPAIALAAMQVAGDEREIPARFSRSSIIQTDKRSPSWVRSDEFLLPYAGKPGTFERISYSDVLDDDFDLTTLAGKYVLVGVSAIGLGDVISTPVSGERNPMPGIEVVANEIDALRQNLMISQGGFWSGLIVTCMMVLGSYFLWGFLAPRYSLFCGAALIALVILVDAWLLHAYRVWFAPTTAILGLSLGYMGWVWGRLVETVKYLNSELNRLGDAAVPLKDSERQDAHQAVDFLMNIDGFYGGSVKDEQGKTLFEWTNESTESPDMISSDELTTITGDLTRTDGEWKINLLIDENRISHDDAGQITKQLSEYYSTPVRITSKTPVEFINSRIELVRAAHSRLYFLSEFITKVLDQLHVGVVVTDTFGGVLMANRGAGILLGSQQKNLRGTGIFDVLPVLKFKNNPAWHTIFSDVMFGSQEFVHEASTSSGRDLLLEITRYLGRDESVSGMVFNIIDVTTLKQAEQSRHELLAFLSHDLRSPLASLIATSDLARLQPEYRDSEAFLKTIKNSAGRALHMADDFLVLVHAEGISPDSFTPVDLAQVILEETRNIESQASRKSITVQHRLDPDIPVFVNGDRTILERVVNNLLTNAIKYSSHGQMIEAGLAVQADEAHCWVKDTGYGINDADREKIFKRFERVRHQDNPDEAGIGLGLAFVNLSVERHQGRIELESEVGKGSCFHIYLPLLTERTDLHRKATAI